jgi:hypothetical protein
MDLRTTSMLASVPAYAIQFDVGKADASRGDTPAMETPPAAPTSIQAREVQARLAALVAEVHHTERHLRDVIGVRDAQLLDGANLDVALRMPRNAVERRTGRLRLVSGRAQVVSPTAEELAHLRLGDERDDR